MFIIKVKITNISKNRIEHSKDHHIVCCNLNKQTNEWKKGLVQQWLTDLSPSIIRLSFGSNWPHHVISLQRLIIMVGNRDKTEVHTKSNLSFCPSVCLPFIDSSVRLCSFPSTFCMPLTNLHHISSFLPSLTLSLKVGFY